MTAYVAADLAIVHDRLPSDSACPPQPAPGEGARACSPSLGQAQNRRRYCHLERTVPEFPPVTEYRHRCGSDSADPVDTGDPTRSARVRARRLWCHP